jgi:hypothetical protein
MTPGRGRDGYAARRVRPAAAMNARAVIVLALAGITGCASSEPERSSDRPPATPAKRSLAATPYLAPAVSKSAERPRARAAERRRTARRRRLVHSVASSQLGLVGIDDAAIDTQRRGRAVRITLSEDTVCDVRPGTGRDVAHALDTALAFVQDVDVRVYGFSGSLGRYLKKSCGRGAIPEPPFTASGSGSTTTAPFTIRASNWVLEYEAGDGAFRLRLLRDGRLVRQIGSPPSGSGSRMIAGSGVYRIQVVAADEWSVRAREER